MQEEDIQEAAWFHSFQRLRARWECGGSTLTEDEQNLRRLPINAIQTIEAVFQPRLMEAQLVESGKHLKELRRALCAKGALDAITVFKIGGEWFCIDGHHRLEAYRQAGGRRTHIPVRVFQGSLAEAFSYSIAANAPDKLNLSRDDKYESAWRMVLLGVYTVRQINASTTVSNGTIQNMTEAAKTVGQQWPLSPVEDFSWSQVKHLLRSGMPKENTMWQEAKVKEWAKKLARSFNGVPNKHPKLFAQALLLYDRGTAQSIAYEIQRQTESEQSDF